MAHASFYLLAITAMIAPQTGYALTLQQIVSDVEAGRRELNFPQIVSDLIPQITADKEAILHDVQDLVSDGVPISALVPNIPVPEHMIDKSSLIISDKEALRADVLKILSDLIPDVPVPKLGEKGRELALHKGAWRSDVMKLASDSIPHASGPHHLVDKNQITSDTKKIQQDVLDILSDVTANKKGAPHATTSTVTSYILPKYGIMCLQGPESYLTDVLGRLSGDTSTMRIGWLNSTVQHGTCASLGYTEENMDPCFWQLKLWFDWLPEHRSRVNTMDTDFVAEGRAYKAAHPDWPFPLSKIGPSVQCDE